MKLLKTLNYQLEPPASVFHATMILLVVLIVSVDFVPALVFLVLVVPLAVVP